MIGIGQGDPDEITKIAVASWKEPMVAALGGHFIRIPLEFHGRIIIHIRNASLIPSTC